MMFIDLTGNRFGYLTVIERAKNRSKQTAWHCVCECGKRTIVAGANLKNKGTVSCGCKRGKHNNHYKKHSKSKTRLYKIYIGMKYRCYNSNATEYKYYGYKGIGVCDEWMSEFEVFYGWAINNGYSDNLSIDRIDVDGNYSPSNCRWSNEYTQKNNRGKYNVVIEHNGESNTLAEWATLKGIGYQTLRRRLSSGWSIESALNKPTRNYGGKNSVSI